MSCNVEVAVNDNRLASMTAAVGDAELLYEDWSLTFRDFANILSGREVTLPLRWNLLRLTEMAPSTPMPPPWRTLPPSSQMICEVALCARDLQR
jgi:hypothetical protein